MENEGANGEENTGEQQSCYTASLGELIDCREMDVSCFTHRNT